MDNQHRSPDEGNVQRSSRKRVLDLIIWETPQVEGRYYIYKLVNLNQKDNVRYVGITSDPFTRLSHHLCNSSIKKKSYKNSWIKSVLNKNEKIVMIVFDFAESKEDALIKEEYYISVFNKLTNIQTKPTSPGSKKCYLYNLRTNTTYEMNSLTQAASKVGYNSVSLNNNLTIKSEWMFSYENDFDVKIKKFAKIKAMCLKTKSVKYFISYKHCSWNLNISTSMVNLCLSKERKSANNHLITRINDNFDEYINVHHKKIVCKNDGNVFDTIKDAANFYNVDLSAIVKCCKNKRKHVKGLNFNYLL